MAMSGLGRPLAAVGRVKSERSATRMRSRASSSKNKFISKLFWPVQANQSASGFIVGWNIRNFIACVAAVIPFGNVNEI